MSRPREIVQEQRFLLEFARQDHACLACEEAVAVPTITFASGTVEKTIDGILRKRLFSCREERIQRRIGRTEGRLERRLVVVQPIALDIPTQP